MDIKELIRQAVEDGVDITGQLRRKSISVPPWSLLEKEYDPMKHPVMDKKVENPDTVLYEDRVSETETDEFGNPKTIRVAVGTEKVSRVAYALQALAVKRTTELCFGIPVKRKYFPANERQEKIATYIENILSRNRIDTVNIERGRQLFASCEIMTLWYATLSENNLYGFKSKLKLRCITYSPMLGDSLYPLFDERGDLVALSVAYTRMVEDKSVDYFDTFTAEKHLRWDNSDAGGGMKLQLTEDITTGKIPAVYMYRPLPVWENTSWMVYEIEWAVSRNGNYLRRNSRPILALFADEEVPFGKSPVSQSAARDVVHYPKGSSLSYVTWNQAIDNLKYYVEELKRAFFTQLQLPDLSYENMKTSPMSGEARKQLFIDCQLKVRDESGRWLEFFEREINVIKSFLKQMLPDDWADDIDALMVESIITPYAITDEKDSVELLMTKNGNKPLMSQRESIRELGQSENVDKTIEEIREESMQSAMNLSL